MANGIVRLFLLLFLCIFPTVSCTWWMTGQPGREGVSSSLVDFLYPNGEEPPPVGDTKPTLMIPLRVGVAFVPSLSGESVLSEVTKANLLEAAATQFRDRDYISNIEVIPETYLRGRRGFETVDQVARLYNLDVMALVSYDQVAVAADTKASILYWTIVGAYVIEGSKHNVQTFVDTAVIDVRTHKLLFRAPGVAASTERSTLVGTPEVVREQRQEGFEVAMKDMTGNLTTELERFRERIKSESVATVAQRNAGGSGASPYLLVLLGALWLARRARPA